MPTSTCTHTRSLIHLPAGAWRGAHHAAPAPSPSSRHERTPPKPRRPTSTCTHTRSLIHLPAGAWRGAHHAAPAPSPSSRHERTPPKPRRPTSTCTHTRSLIHLPAGAWRGAHHAAPAPSPSSRHERTPPKPRRPTSTCTHTRSLIHLPAGAWRGAHHAAPAPSPSSRHERTPPKPRRPTSTCTHTRSLIHLPAGAWRGAHHAAPAPSPSSRHERTPPKPRRPTSDGEKKRQGLIRTIPRSTPRCTCDRKCRARPHLYAAPRSQADPKYTFYILKDKGVGKTEEAKFELLKNLQRFDSREWADISFFDIQKSYLAVPGFKELETNDELRHNDKSKYLASFEKTLASLTHAFLLHRDHTQTCLQNILKWAGQCENITAVSLKDKITDLFVEDDKYNKSSNDILQILCGKRADVVLNRRSEILKNVTDTVTAAGFRKIPPSYENLFQAETLKEFLKMRVV
ncbi:uncharacterized protein LOC133534099 [Cydia pomonella]|uniref:uncharacterized protein LOC133534099 n=1 Tax=Cydia pomonella TaxID=82600 RepID=UPI002ADD55EC|nr:uncharacterized protein LOC133534099 [Cydia pomonella]